MTIRLRSDAGFTMIELSIAMMLTATVLALALTGFQNLADAGDGGSLTTDLNVNLRSTLNLMSRDLIRAGSRNIPVGGIPIPSGADSVPIVRPSINDTLTFPLRDTMPAVTPGDGLGPAIGDDPATQATEGVVTDMISIMTTDETIALDQYKLTNLAGDGTSATVDARTSITGDSNGVTAGDLLWLKNGMAQTLVMVTGRNGQIIQFAANDPMHLNQPNAESGSIMRLMQDDDGVTVRPLPDTFAVRVLMVTYYIDNTDTTRPKLMRRINMRAPRVIGVVVENLQLTYDIADGVNNASNVAAPANPNQIRKANLFVAGRSHREWRRTHDYLRTYVATQVSLRSLAFVDRYNTPEEDEQ